MPLTRLQHFLVYAADLEATKNFYVDVLGLKVGKRPPFKFPGYWLYLGRDSCIHLAGPSANASQLHHLGRQGESDGADTGAIDHIAFQGANYPAMLAKLKRLGFEMRLRTVPNLGLRQIFLKDPNGVTLELNFAAARAAKIAPRSTRPAAKMATKKAAKAKPARKTATRRRPAAGHERAS